MGLITGNLEREPAFFTSNIVNVFWESQRWVRELKASTLTLTHALPHARHRPSTVEKS